MKMSYVEELKLLYRQQAEQFKAIMQKIKSLPRYREFFAELSTFYYACEKRMTSATHMAEKGVAQTFAITPPTTEKFQRFKTMIRFSVVFHELWAERLAINYNSYLCAPPYDSTPGIDFPFFVTGYGYNNDFKKKELEVINNPSMIDAEITRYRNRMRDGFKHYGEQNLRTCEARIQKFSALPFAL